VAWIDTSRVCRATPRRWAAFAGRWAKKAWSNGSRPAIETAVQIKAIKPAERERVIVGTTVQEKAVAHAVDSRLQKISRHKVVSAAKQLGISPKQTFAAEAKELRRNAGGSAHAKQFKRLKQVVKR
jgi:transposase, IS5 family